MIQERSTRGEPSEGFSFQQGKKKRQKTEIEETSFFYEKQVIPIEILSHISFFAGTSHFSSVCKVWRKAQYDLVTLLFPKTYETIKPERFSTPDRKEDEIKFLYYKKIVIELFLDQKKYLVTIDGNPLEKMALSPLSALPFLKEREEKIEQTIYVDFFRAVNLEGQIFGKVPFVEEKSKETYEKWKNRVEKKSAELATLEELDLSVNSLFGIPKEIEYFSNLKLLDLSNNLIYFLPSYLTKLEHLDRLDVSNNPISKKDLKEDNSLLSIPAKPGNLFYRS